jgi:hypothetical protein
MRARALFAATVGSLFLAVAIPAAAKALIAEAHQRGGIGGRRPAHLRSGHGGDVGLRDRCGREPG